MGDVSWREKQAAHPDPHQVAVDVWFSSQGEFVDRMENAIDAYEAACEIVNQCDEPGCEQQASCGFPVDGGYRRTCSAHYRASGAQGASMPDLGGGGDA